MFSQATQQRKIIWLITVKATSLMDTQSLRQISAGALVDVKVLDLTAVGMGPYCTQILADYGANVIKVESPQGDVFRYASPTKNPGMSSPFIQFNRNKRSVVLDLKRPNDLALLIDLAKSADVLVYNIRPQSMRKLGLGYEQLQELNPKLIYCGVYGFSEKGAYAGEPAFDDIIQAMGGMASLQGRDQAPGYVTSIIADKVGGLTAAHAILAALFERTTSNQGQQIEIPMFETLVAFNMLEHMGEATFAKPNPKMGYARATSPHRKPYKTKDGYIGLLPYTTEQWHRFFELAGQPDVMLDDRFAQPGPRAQNIEQLYAKLDAIVEQKTTQEWLTLLKDADIPAAKVNKLPELFDDEHLRSVDFFHHHVHPTEGEIVMPKSPVNMSRTPATVRSLAPGLGEHTEQVRKAGWEK